MATRTAKTASKEKEIDSFIAGMQVDAVGIANLESVDPRIAERVRQLLPSARSLVVVAVEVYPEVLAHATTGKKIGDITMKTLMESHADFLNHRLNDAVYMLAKACHLAGYKALPLPAAGLPFEKRIQTAVFSYKHAAVAAGLGSLGRSSLLITPKFGPRVRLAVCLTEAALKPTRAKKPHKCAACHVCIEHCPSEALARARSDEPYSINKFACNSYRAEGYCFECLRLCPAGK